MESGLIKFQTDHGEVELSPAIIRQYLVPSGTAVSDQEVKLFLELCKYQGLNPFLREVYLVKYGDYPASMVTGKEVFTKRAMSNPKFAGLTAGITVVGRENKLYRREGSLLLTGESLIGGWAKVHIKEYAVPFFEEVSLAEYEGKKKDGTKTGMWATKPATMIRKVAIVHALREAFPEQFEGLYSQEEINTIDSSKLPTGEVHTDDVDDSEQDEVPDNANPDEPAPPVAPVAPVPPPKPAKAPYPQATAPDDVGSFKSPFFKKYPGKSLREIYTANSGYVKFMGDNGKDPAIREIIKKFLAGVDKAQPVKDITPIEEYDAYGAPPPDDTNLPFDL